MDKRSEGQFRNDNPLRPIPTIETGEGVPNIEVATAKTAIGPARKGHDFLKINPEYVSTLPFIGGAGSRMKAISKSEREEPIAPDRSLTRIEGKPWRTTDTKGGRSALAKDLGLPNKKEFRAKKKK